MGRPRGRPAHSGHRGGWQLNSNISQSPKEPKQGQSEDSKPLWERADQKLKEIEELGKIKQGQGQGQGPGSDADVVHELTQEQRQERDQSQPSTSPDHGPSFRLGQCQMTYRTCLITLATLIQELQSLKISLTLAATLEGGPDNPTNQKLRFLGKKSDQNLSSLTKAARRLRKGGRLLGLDTSLPAKKGQLSPRASEAIAEEQHKEITALKEFMARRGRKG